MGTMCYNDIIKPKEHDRLEPQELARAIIEAIYDRRGFNILLLDIHSLSAVADYFVISSGNNPLHIRAIAQEVGEKTGALGQGPFRVEGEAEAGWMVMDYGSIVVHIFAPAQRAYYDLEGLWEEAPLVVSLQ